MLLRIWLLFALLVLGACAKKHADYDSYGGGYGYAAEADMGAVAVSRSSRGSYKASGGAPSRAPAPPPAEPMMEMADDAAYDEAYDDGGGGEDPMEPEAPARMVHYNGYAQVRVARTSEGIDQVRAIAEDKGGFVERIGGDHVVIRVPVAEFEATMEEVYGLGDVLSKSITADDVTEAFTSVSLRLETAKATRERLVALLAKAKDEREKLEILKQIQRLTDDIDRMESQARTLSQLASMSRITVQLVAREALAWQGPGDEAAELAWIRSLSPFRTDMNVEVRKLMLDEPEGMVALDVKKRFVAESADGSRIWSHRILNDPEGDATFWLSSVEERLSGDFAKAERLTIGGYQALRLVDRSDEPYTWVIALRVSGKHLEVVQVYYASAEQEARYKDAVAAVLGGGAA